MSSLFNKLKIGLNLYANRGVTQNDFSFAGNGQGSLVAKALTWDPTTPIYDANGEFNKRSIKGIASLNEIVIRTLSLSDAQIVNEQLTSALNVEWNITNDLTYTTILTSFENADLTARL